MKIYNLVRYVLEEKIKHNEDESNEFSSIADYFNSHTTIKERPIITFIWYLQNGNYWMNQSLRLPAEICFMMKMENMSEPRKRY